MEHAKKMLLLDPKLYRPSIREKTLSRLDDEINDTLSSELIDEEKARKYIIALKKYRRFNNPTVIKDDVMDESEVLKSFPANSQHQAKRLLDGLKKEGGLKIASDGTIEYRQQRFPDSSITSLLDELMSKKSREKAPDALPEFLESVVSAKIPKELISNESSWKRMYPPPSKLTRKERKLAKDEEEEDYKIDTKRRSRRGKWIQ